MGESDERPARIQLVLITGMSGSGKSSVAKCLEDLGYYCVDNLPVTLLRTFLQDPPAHLSDIGRVAVVADVRAAGVAAELPELIAGLDRERIAPVLLFLDTSDEVLLRRYSETRRRHPLSQDEPVIEAIRRERALLADLRGLADRVFDTSEWTIHEVRAEVTREFSPQRWARSGLSVSLVSFGFKHGIPYGADMVLDVRYLPNPHFVPELQPLSGLDAPVLEFFARSEEFELLAERLGDLLEFLLPRFDAENRSYLTVGIGCTGGRHRSVALVERLAARLHEGNWTVRAVHRDLDRVTASQAPSARREQSS
ncbi:MAG TPA: RNase adapter RapZ [Thermoanaerobaculia bacterium]|nr:RNase adapter RapZ [Thermoanaerobaculia bacterium]